MAYPTGRATAALWRRKFMDLGAESQMLARYPFDQRRLQILLKSDKSCR